MQAAFNTPKLSPSNDLASPLTDVERLRALRATGLMDSAPEERFDRITRLASRTLNAPVALVSLVDDKRQFFKSAFGLDRIAKDTRETPLDYSICQRIVMSGEPFLMNNGPTDLHLRHELAVTDLGVVAYAGVPLTAGDGQIIGSFCVIDTQPRNWSEEELAVLRDLAESVNSEVRLQLAKDAAESANRAKDRFLAVLSHELRMPISPALMIVQEMSSDPTLPQTVRDDAAMVQRNIEQQVRLIDDLLDLTRIENGKLDVRLELLCLQTVVQNAVAHFRGEALIRRIDLRLDLGKTPLSVNGDAGRLLQVFGNLLKNAIKFTPAAGVVSVVVAADNDGNAIVKVQDTGIGISPEILPDLFEAFAQGPRTRVSEFGGLGLGLAIAKGIVDEHGGRIEAMSDGEGQGTTFNVYLPLATQSTALKFSDESNGGAFNASESNTRPARAGTSMPAAAASKPIPEAGKSSVSILLVDDHEDTLRAMTRLLRKLDHRVVAAATVKDALGAAQDQKFDLLISDVGLPDGTGMDLMRRLCESRPIPGIALTGYGSDADHERTMEAGFCAHLTKPIDLQQLADVINKIAAQQL